MRILLICCFLLPITLSSLIEEEPLMVGVFCDQDIVIHTLAYKATNVYLVEQGGNIVMIDTGYASSRAKIEQAINDLACSMGDIDYLVLTHGHGDHVGNAAYFQKEYGITLIGGAGDLSLFEKGDNGETCPTSFFARLLGLGAPKSYEAFTPELLMDSPLDLSEYGLRGRIFTLPGHTQGSLVVELSNHLFVGDIIRGKPLNKDKPAKHYYHCDLKQNAQNIAYLLDNSAAKLWYPGHFGALKKKDVLSYIERI